MTGRPDTIRKHIMFGLRGALPFAVLLYLAIRQDSTIQWWGIVCMTPILIVVNEFPVRILTLKNERTFVVVFDDAFIVFSMFVLNPLSAFLVVALAGAFSDIRNHVRRDEVFYNIFLSGMSLLALMLIAGAPIQNLTSETAVRLLVAFLMVIPIDLAVVWTTEPSLAFIKSKFSLFVNKPRLTVFLFGISIGIPAGILYHTEPIALPFLAIVFVIVLTIQMGFQNAREERDRLQELMDIFVSVDDEITMEEVQNRLLEIAGRSTFWEDIEIRSESPGENETGVVIKRLGQDDLWLVAPRGDSSNWRLSRDLKYLETVAVIGARAFEHVYVQEQLRDAARRDMLTGLVNRRTLTTIVEHDLAAVRRNNGTLTILFIDVDKFKPVNDTYGHAAGDSLLQMLSSKLLSVVREQDVVARLGGDEFVISCRDMTPSDSEEMAQRLVQRIEEPFEVMSESGENVMLSVSASIGIATAPYDASTLDELIGAADAQMYRAKQLPEGSRISAATQGKNSTFRP